MSLEQLKEKLITVCGMCDKKFDGEPLGNLRTLWLIDKFLTIFRKEIDGLQIVRFPETPAGVLYSDGWNAAVDAGLALLGGEGK